MAEHPFENSMEDPAELQNGADVIELNTDVDPLLIHWARFREQFAERMADGFWTIEDLEYRIAQRQAFFFPGKEAALVGQIRGYPGGERAFTVSWSVGPGAEIVTILPGVEAMARMLGCTSIMLDVRGDGELIEGYALWAAVGWKAL